MLLDASSVAAVLEELDGTLDEVVGRVASPELNADLVVRRAPRRIRSEPGPFELATGGVLRAHEVELRRER